MTRRKAAPAGIGERVEQAVARSRGRLRLWLVFDEEDEVAQAKMLIAAARSRHVEALTRAEWRRREERALGRLAPPPVPVP